MLAIVAPSFNLVSETFITDHVRKIAPGHTVLVCQDSLGAEKLGLPVLSHLRTPPGPVRRRLGAELSRDDRARLAAFLTRQGVTHVLAEYGPMGMAVASTCRDLGLPLHVIFHGHDASAILSDKRIRRLYREMFGQITKAICVSDLLADNLRAIGAPESILKVQPCCGVDTSRFTPGDPEPGRVLALGRLTEKKAPHLTIRAFAEAARDIPGARLDIAGDGPLRPACEAEIAAQGMEERVTLHGALPHEDVRNLMRRASIFAQHSVVAPSGDVESMPVSISEAMATAIPVVATRHSGIVLQVEEGVTGYLVDEGDVEGMAAGLERLLRDPEEARRMGAAGRARVARFDQDVLCRNLRETMGLPPAMAAA